MAMVSGSRSVTLVPSARLAGDVDGAAQALHALPHHVHAHAAAGDIGDLLGRRKTGLKDERENLGFAQAGVGGNQAFFDRAPAHRFRIDAAAVVRNRDQHAGARSAAPKDECARSAVCRARRALRRVSMP